MASKSAKGFNADLKKFGEVTERQASQIFRKVALDLDAAVVLDTPVDEGRARGNWYPSINTPSNEVDEDSLGAAKSLNRLNGVIGKAKLGQVIWLTNNLPYIIALENGHSKQAAEGMVDVNALRFAAAFGGSIVR